jgi:hypothetical protein
MELGPRCRRLNDWTVVVVIMLLLARVECARSRSCVYGRIQLWELENLSVIR